jgi:N-acyl-L-homoserine lactone synthetase
MAYIETGVCGPGKDDLLKSMFEARKRVFVDLLKWEVPVLNERFEVDEFDNSHATYIIVTDTAGEHLGSARLLETTRPHILGSLFPQLCAEAVPAGPDVVEITRFCLDRNLGASARRQVRNRLVSALVAHALQSGIRTYTGVAEIAWLQQILAFGWDCRPLGLPQYVGRRMIGALAIAVGPDTPALLNQNAIWVDEEVSETALSQAA